MATFKESVAPWIGLVAIVGFAILLFVLLSHTSDTEAIWSRKIYLFGAVEAIALAAVGYFFGKDVHRERAERAEARAEVAQNAAQTERGEKSATEQKLTDIINYIEERAVTRRSAPAIPLDELTDLAKRSGDQILLRDLMTFSEERPSPGQRRGVDSDWDELRRYVGKLARRG